MNGPLGFEQVEHLDGLGDPARSPSSLAAAGVAGEATADAARDDSRPPICTTTDRLIFAELLLTSAVTRPHPRRPSFRSPRFLGRLDLLGLAPAAKQKPERNG